MIDAPADGDTEFILEAIGHLGRYSGILATNEHRRHRDHVGIEPSINSMLDAAQKCLGSQQILLS